MTTTNPFLLLGDDDESNDPHHLAQKLPLPAAKSAPAAQAEPTKNAKLPSKPLPPAQAVREAKSDGPRGGGRSGGRGAGRGRGGRGYNRESLDNENGFGSNNGFSGGYRPSEEGDVEKSSERRGYDAPRGGYRGGGGRRGGYSNGDAADGERPRRVYDRRSGTGRGSDFKRDGSGRGNWGTPTDDAALETEEPVNETEKVVVEVEKPAAQEDAADAPKENPEKEPEEKEPEEKEMTLAEYEKVLEEKRKALLAQKAEERTVVLDKDFEKMQVLSKGEEEIFAKLGTDKEKRKEAADKEERAKKSVTINEFLKPAEGEKYFTPGGRGRGRGRGPRGGGGFNGGRFSGTAAPSIGDASQFPSLGVK